MRFLDSSTVAVALGSAGVSPAVFGVSPKTFLPRGDALFGKVPSARNQSAGRRLERPGRSRSPISTVLAALAVGSWLMLGGIAIAHDGPEHEIEELTERIKSEGESADLLLQRAIEYNVLNKSAEAIKDLKRALDFDSDSAMIQNELSRAYFAAGKTNEAFDTVNRAIKHTEEFSELASLLMVRCELHRSRKEHQKALDDADRAIRKHPVNAEWYHTRSLLQQQLGLKKERITGLENGIKETGSGLLEADFIDALIDGGKTEAALARIEVELKDGRLQSSWLIRRAKVRLALKQEDEAKADLEAALAELNHRITPTAKDPLLLADRGQAYDLLGKREEAKKDYERAREKGMNDEWVRERLRAFKEAEDKKKESEKKKNGDKDKKEDKDKSDETEEKPEDKADDDAK